MGDAARQTTLKDKGTGASTWFRAIWPLAIHFLLTILIAAVMVALVNDHNFGINTRALKFTEVDGSTTSLSFEQMVLLQTDVTTVLSVGQTVLRIVAGGWTASTLWRCLFILMRVEGLSLDEVSWMMKKHLPARIRGSHSHLVFLIAIILVAALPTHFSSPILTGSITWEPSSIFVPGLRPVSGIAAGIDPLRLNLYETFRSVTGNFLVESGSSLAAKTWDEEDITSSTRRYLPVAGNLPVGTVFNNVTVPHFVVDKIEWIQGITNTTAPKFPTYPDSDHSFFPYSDGLNPYTAMFPPNGIWGPSQVNFTSSVVSRTQIAAVIFHNSKNRTDDDDCSVSEFFGKAPPGLTPVPYFETSPPPLPPRLICYAFARVTFRAGVVTCKQCPLVAPRVVQLPNFTHTPLELEPHFLTEQALQIAPTVAHPMLVGNISVPPAFNNFDSFVPEVLARSYQTTWTAFANYLQSSTDSVSTRVTVPIPLTKAHVELWRVYLWTLLNLLLTFSGLLFLYVLKRSGEQMVVEPQVHAILLNSANLSDKHPELRLDRLPRLTTEISSKVGRLHLKEVDGRRILRQVNAAEGIDDDRDSKWSRTSYA